MPGTDILKLGVNKDEFNADMREIYDQSVKTYEILQKLDGYKLNINSTGWQDLKNSAAGAAEAEKKLAEAELLRAKAEKELSSATLNKAKADTEAQKAASSRIKSGNDAVKQANEEKKALALLTDERRQLNQTLKDQEVRYANLYLTQGKNNQLTIDAKNEVLKTRSVLDDLNNSIGRYHDNVGNYSSAFTGYANTLRGLRGPVKILGEALGIGAQEADQFRLLIEHASQGIAAFFRGKEAKAAAENKDTVATAANTVANQANAVANEEVAATATAATGAVTALRIALIGMGIGLVLAGIGYMIYKWKEYKESVNEAERSQKALNEVLKEANKTAGEEIGKLEALYQVATDNKIAIDKRKEAIQELQKEFPEHFKNINEDIILQGKATEAYNATKDAILASAQAMAVQGKLSSLATQELDVLTEQNDLTNKLTKANVQLGIQRQKAIDAGFNPKGMAGSLGSENENLRLIQLEIKGYNDKAAANKKSLDQIHKDQQFFLGQLKDVPTSKGGGGGADINKKEVADKTAQYLFEKNKAILQDSMNTEKAIMDDTNSSLVRRMQAFRDYYDDKMKLEELDKNYQIFQAKEAADKELNQEGITADQKKRIQANLAAQIEAINAGYQTKINDAARSSVSDYKKLITDKYDTEGKEAAISVDNLVKLAQDGQKKMLDDEKKFHDEEKKQDKDAADAKKQKEKEIADYKKQLYNDLFELAKTLGDAQFENEKNRIQKLIDANNEYKAAELDRIQNSTLSEQEKADKTIELNAKVDAQNKVLQQQQKEFDIKKAKFDKAAAIAQIIEQTAINVVAAVFTKPWLIPLIIATGAAELAIAAAQPIPSYAEGTEDHPGGPARYGEAGPEAVTLPGGKTFLANKETISFLPKGSKVKPITTDVIDEAMNRSMIIGTANMIAMSEMVSSNSNNSQDAWAIAKWQSEEMRQALAEMKRPVTQVNIYNELGFKRHIDKYVFGKRN